MVRNHEIVRCSKFRIKKNKLIKIHSLIHCMFFDLKKKTDSWRNVIPEEDVEISSLYELMFIIFDEEKYF